jgi:hypothetical protein
MSSSVHQLCLNLAIALILIGVGLKFTPVGFTGPQRPYDAVHSPITSHRYHDVKSGFIRSIMCINFELNAFGKGIDCFLSVLRVIGEIT